MRCHLSLYASQGRWANTFGNIVYLECGLTRRVVVDDAERFQSYVIMISQYNRYKQKQLEQPFRFAIIWRYKNAHPG